MTDLHVERDLRDAFGPARDQGQRPTCLAFAASDAHAALREGWEPLSCEYAFFQAQRRQGRPPNVGALLPDMLDALETDGQPAEEGWPYLDTPPTDAREWRPPPEVGDLFRRLGEPRTKSIDEVIFALDHATPVLVLMYLSDSFYFHAHSGFIEAQVGERPDPQRRHAVIAVGHGVHKGRRAILIRNSWGRGWGHEGHAWLCENFLAERLMQIAALTEDIDDHIDQRAA